VRQNVDYFRKVLRLGPEEVDRVIGAVDLGEQSHSLVGSLSGGQQSRVSLAAALLGSPELLILDEPTVGLDPVLRRDLWTLFAALAAAGVTLLVSSHVMEEANRCDRLLLLRGGSLLADETPAGLLERTGAADSEAAFLALIDAAEAQQ
jgi:ABC-2 type transport system ATP-binding protein